MIRLYVSVFNNDIAWMGKGIPLEVGADLRKEFHYPLKDNTGDNISADNEYWGELTGLYWIWKNAESADDDIIGFAHYNKLLLISDKRVEAYLKSSEKRWIALTSIKLCPHTYPGDVDALRKAILDNCGNEYFAVWDTLYDKSGGGNQSAVLRRKCFIRPEESLTIIVIFCLAFYPGCGKKSGMWSGRPFRSGTARFLENVC